MSEEVKVERKKRSLSLIQPTSIPTLGPGGDEGLERLSRRI